MLRYILPPIIIIISLSILVIFLFRKVRQIPVQELDLENETSTHKTLISKITSSIWQFILKILEKIIQRLKLFALKSHNISNDWFHSIHDKRQKRLLEDQKESQLEKEKQNKKSDVIDEGEIDQQMTSQKFKFLENEKRNIRPLIRKTVTNPQKPIKEKNQLEEVLIKRIAVNPRDIEAYERLGDYYLESCSYQDSQECFNQVLMLSPSHYKARVRLRKLKGLLK
jgi:hypothetical protein